MFIHGEARGCIAHALKVAKLEYRINEFMSLDLLVSTGLYEVDRIWISQFNVINIDLKGPCIVKVKSKH